MRTKIKYTGDGSSTLYVPQLKEHYHSVYGAVQESMHVFVQMGLKILKPGDISIMEIGFGTGLNVLLTLIQSQNFNSIVYYAIEKYPLKWERVKQLHYEDYLKLPTELRKDFRKMHLSPWNSLVSFRDNFILHKIKIDLLEYQSDMKFDLIYFDAFAPAIQPELWKETLFSMLFYSLNPGGILVTYCAKGEVRRKLQNIGFQVERLKGPPGKHEMMRATRKLY